MQLQLKSTRGSYKNLTKDIERLLKTADLRKMNSHRCAELFLISPSTLRRQLRFQKTCYRFLLNQERIRRFNKVLSRQRPSTNHMTNYLGFTHINHYYRWVSKTCGVGIRHILPGYKIQQSSSGPYLPLNAIQ